MLSAHGLLPALLTISKCPQLYEEGVIEAVEQSETVKTEFETLISVKAMRLLLSFVFLTNAAAVKFHVSST